MEIFAEKRLHPGQDTPFKQHYQDQFDTVFLAFSPFFKIMNDNFSQEGLQKSKQITFEQAQASYDFLRTMPKLDANIYSYENEVYPNDADIYLKAESVSWLDIKNACGFANYGEVIKAIKTSIGAYKKVFLRPDLAKRLSDYTKANQIYYPTEGHFEVLSKKEIFKAFQLLSKYELVIEEEFCENRKELNITSLTDKEFVERIHFKDYFIYDKDKELLFAVDWDDFFFLICSSRQNVEKLISTVNFEGFYCDDTTETAWELTREEIDAGLQNEQQQKEIKQENQPVNKKPWWKIW